MVLFILPVPIILNQVLRFIRLLHYLVHAFGHKKILRILLSFFTFLCLQNLSYSLFEQLPKSLLSGAILFDILVQIGNLLGRTVLALALGVGFVLEESLLDLALEHVHDPLG